MFGRLTCRWRTMRLNRLIKHLNRRLMAAINDLNTAVGNLQAAVTAALPVIGVNPAEDAAVEAAVATINSVVSQLNAAVAAATPPPSAVGTTSGNKS